MTTPSTAGEKSAGADLEQMRSKQRASFESRWTRIEKFDDSLHRGMGALKVRDISIPGNCEVGLTNAGHWGGAQVGALTRW